MCATHSTARTWAVTPTCVQHTCVQHVLYLVKRDLHMTKETYTSQKRPIHDKRDLHMTKETFKKGVNVHIYCGCQKRPICEK